MSDRHKALAAVDALALLLRKEIAAVEAGEFSDLVQFSTEKVRLSEMLEKYLQDDPQAVSKAQLLDLKDLILRDKHYLQVAQQATADVIQEVYNIRERHSIAGLYGPRGSKRDNHATVSATVDKTF
jgi:hypothetical protein|tara:strand:+ start:43004 stop:43381 length:378 start_codon:yes stop_codon:yes gene_type:complete